jgi:DNA replication protein DnaC
MAFSDRHYGDGDPDCPTCGGLGYIRYDVPDDHPYFGRVFDCDCRKSRAAEHRQAYLRRLGGLDHLAEKRLDTFSPEGIGLPAPQRDNLRRAHESAAAYAESPTGWLVLKGGYGCGKTHLAAGIANHCIETGHRVLFVNTADLLDSIRSTFQPDADENYDDRFDEFRTVPLLILDDLGVESPTPWAREKLYQILNHRYNAELPTVITTNHELEDLELRLRSRLADPDLCQIVVITAPDYRRTGAMRDEGGLNNLALYSGMTFESFGLREDEPLHGDQRESLRRALERARAYAEEPQGWLAFIGPYGCGKTHLAAAIANTRISQGESALFVTVPDLLDHLRAAFSPNSLIPYDKRFQEVRTAPLLVLDDLGTESATPWAREKLYQIFNHRYVTGLPTIITTVHKMDDLDPRLATRLTDQRLCMVLAILAPAYHGRPNNAGR